MCGYKSKRSSTGSGEICLIFLGKSATGRARNRRVCTCALAPTTSMSIYRPSDRPIAMPERLVARRRARSAFNNVAKPSILSITLR